jgi:FAD synthase
VRITWVKRLRDVEHFTSVQQLTEQMERDRADALAALAGGRPVPTA